MHDPVDQDGQVLSNTKTISLSSSTKLFRSGTTGGLNEHFRTVLRVLLENLEDSEGRWILDPHPFRPSTGLSSLLQLFCSSTRALVFGVLTEMMKQEALQTGFHGFTELVILKVTN